MPTPRPVVLFSGGLSGDGVARNTVHLANALARRGAPIEVICLKGGALAHDLQGPRLTCLGGASLPRAFALALAVPALRQRLLTMQPSVVVSMGNHAHLPVWAALRGLVDTPRIYRISNDPAHSGMAPAARRLRELCLALVAADATRVVCVSSAIAEREPFRRARRDRRVDVLPNGVDTSRIQARAAEPVSHPWLTDGKPFVVSVGRLHRQKNYEALVDALALVRAGSHSTLRLLVLGAAAPERRAGLERRARALGLADAVRFEGEVANPFPLLARATTYVLPSLWEGASNSLLEALACGTPVVASRTAGNAMEVLAGGRYGVLADPTNAADLARAIAAQIDPTRRVPPGDRAEAFRLEAVTDRLCGIVASARVEHDEIQIQGEGFSHVRPLSGDLRGTNTEH